MTILKIAIVDDSRSFIQLIEARIEELEIIYSGLKVKVTGFTDPVRFVDQFKKGDFNLVLLDQTMPEMKGHAVVESLGKIKGGPLFALITGNRKVDDDLHSSFRNRRVLGIFSKEDLLFENINRLIYLVFMQKKIRFWNKRLRLIISGLVILVSILLVSLVFIVLGKSIC